MQKESQDKTHSLLVMKALEDLKWHYMSRWQRSGHTFDEISRMVHEGESVKSYTTSREGRLLIHLLRVIHNHADALRATPEHPAPIRRRLLTRRQIDSIMSYHSKEYQKTLTRRLFFFLNTSHKFYNYGTNR